MVSLLRFSFLFLILTTSFTTTVATATEYTCLGKSDNPKNDFYAKKLDAIIDYSQKATQKLNSLKVQNSELDTHIASINKQKQDVLKGMKTMSPEAKKNLDPVLAELNKKIKDLNNEKQKNLKGSLPEKLKKNNEELPENYLEYQGINDINAALAKLRFVIDWWADQGLQKDLQTKDTVAGVCKDCDKVPEKKLFQKLLDAFQVPKLTENCVSKSIELKKAENSEIMCESSKTQAGATRNMCVTQNMANYTQWALNKAFDCLGTIADPIDPQVIFKKLNNESTFRFFYSYKGGQGLMQTITCAQDEVLGLSPSTYCGAKNVKQTYRSQARKRLVANMDTNPTKCDLYSGIIDFKKEAELDKLSAKRDDLIAQTNMLKKDDPRYAKMDTALSDNKNKTKALEAKYPKYNERLFDASQGSTCDFVSVQDGIHRNILAGLGLYLHYRSLAEDDLVENFGSNIKKHPQYNKIRDLTALAYYGPTGPGGAKSKLLRMIPDVKAKYKDLSKMTPDDFEDLLVKQFAYIRAVNKSENTINNAVPEDKIQCVE